MNGITPETFKEYSIDNKLNTLFDLGQATYEQSVSGDEKLSNRVEKLENRKKRDTAVSSMSGFVGGAFTVVMAKIFGIGG